MKKLLFFLLFCTNWAFGQELECTIILNSDRVQTQERQILTQLKNAIEQFMKTTRWTNESFEEHEKIKCTIFINLDPSSVVSEGKYAATVQIQSLRPIYGTDYESPILNFFDKNFDFEYVPAQPLIFTENVYTTNLTATLAFYAYTILALDYDSFANYGGNPFYERILNITNNSQQAGATGWSAGDTRNRYWISENLNNPQFLPFREALYIYHRLVMDDFLNDSDKKRERVVEVLEKIKQVRDLRPTAVMLNAFFDAKSNELINIFSQAQDPIREKAVKLLSELDPTNAGNYRKLVR